MASALTRHADQVSTFLENFVNALMDHKDGYYDMLARTSHPRVVVLVEKNSGSVYAELITGILERVLHKTTPPGTKIIVRRRFDKRVNAWSNGVASTVESKHIAVMTTASLMDTGRLRIHDRMVTDGGITDTNSIRETRNKFFEQLTRFGPEKLFRRANGTTIPRWSGKPDDLVLALLIFVYHSMATLMSPDMQAAGFFQPTDIPDPRLLGQKVTASIQGINPRLLTTFPT